MKYNYYPRTVAQALASSCGALKRSYENICERIYKKLPTYAKW